MVRQNLHSREEARYDYAPQVAPPVAERHTRYGRRDEGEGEQLPDVAGGDDDEVVAGEGPQHSAQGGHPCAEVEGAQHDVEAQQHHEYVGRHGGQAQLVERLQAPQRVGAGIGGSHLVGRHSAEERVRPARTLSAMRLAIVLHLNAAAYGTAVVVAGQHQSVADGTQEIKQADEDEEAYGQHVGNNLSVVHISVVSVLYARHRRFRPVFTHVPRK